MFFHLLLERKTTQPSAKQSPVGRASANVERFVTTPSICDLKPSPAGASDRVNLWVEFAALAKKTKAVILGQGFPDTPIRSPLGTHLEDVSKNGERVDFQQYTRSYGHPKLVDAVSKFYSPLLNHDIDAQNEILVTVGAYMALYYSFMAWLNPDDEVIVFEPAFDCYTEQVRMAGGKIVTVLLEFRPNNINGTTTSALFILNVDLLSSKINKRTKMILLNNPNNPTGKLYSRKELEAIASLAKEHNLLVVSDEVYEFHIYPPNQMIRFASLPGMYERTITICSAGKAFSATGWRLGWAIAPSYFLQPMRKIHDNCVFTVPTVTQEAVAREFEHEYELYASGRFAESYLATGIAAELLPKRNRVAKALRMAGFKPIVPDGGYFITADFSNFDGPYKINQDGPLDFTFARWLCREKGLATIPTSAFYSPVYLRGRDRFVRICFIKKDETLNAAIDILQRLGQDAKPKQKTKKLKLRT